MHPSCGWVGDAAAWAQHVGSSWHLVNHLFSLPKRGTSPWSTLLPRALLCVLCTPKAPRSSSRPGGLRERRRGSRSWTSFYHCCAALLTCPCDSLLVLKCFTEKMKSAEPSSPHPTGLFGQEPHFCVDLLTVLSPLCVPKQVTCCLCFSTV